MVILWVTNPRTREDIPVETFATPEDALNRKDELRVKHPGVIFFYTTNGLEITPDELRPLATVIKELQNV